MSSVDDLVTWLRQQLDDDERVAKAASAGPWRVGSVAYELGIADVEYDGGQVTSAYSEPCCVIEDAEHIARHDPARVLAEVDAKRRILDEHAPVADGTQSGWAWFEGSESRSERILRLLALPYGDRPGYRDEWRP